jgi:Cu+-exporting ATPase
MKTEFIVTGMHCASCKSLIEDICKETKGVTKCNVDLKSGKVVIEHTEKVDMKNIKKEIESLGDEYKVKL